MRIAVQSSDLDHARIDGTRVYLKEMLKRFGSLAPNEEFLLYHAHTFNPSLAPPKLGNYKERQVSFPRAWMQTRFAWELFRERPEKLFLPIQAAPIFMPRSLDVTATIHDLAFKKYPDTFPDQMLFKLNFLLETVVKRANKLIAVSQSTKDDLVRYFPALDPSVITVIHHGFDAEFFQERSSDEVLSDFLKKHDLAKGAYLLYVGALQPRKNLIRLIEAFEISKKTYPDMKLVFIGERAWLSDSIVKKAEESYYRSDIRLIGAVSFQDLRSWYQGARIFAFPSLYEGFGIPVLEAMASRVPVLTADNSSLREVAGDAAFYVDAEDTTDIVAKLGKLWDNESLRQELISKGNDRLAHFSWDTCARKTLRAILR